MKYTANIDRFSHANIGGTEMILGGGRKRRCNRRKKRRGGSLPALPF